MASYRIVCTQQIPVNAPRDHAHIVRVGVGTEDGWNNMLTVPEVFVMMAQGDTFYTIGLQSRQRASVKRVRCSVCNHDILRSGADAMRDNNLDSLVTCKA